MKPILYILAFCFALSGCAPLAMFASGDARYRTRLGVQISHNNVNTLCLSPALRLAIWEFEGHFHRKIVMNSGYRTPWHNASVGGASSSQHMKCNAADFTIPGVAKSDLIAFAKRQALVGGLGCYPGRSFIHIDVRSRPRGYHGPVTWGC